MKGIENFIDQKGKIKIWPSKNTVKLEVLKYLADKFENNHIYSEKEVNKIIEDWHTFNDYFLLRRALIECSLMSRTRDGSKYWRNEEKISIEKIDWC
jgi:hypothetical protein